MKNPKLLLEHEVITLKAIQRVENIMDILMHFNNHELRSPICRLAGALELLKYSENLPEELLEIMEISLDDLLVITESITNDLNHYQKELTDISKKLSNP